MMNRQARTRCACVLAVCATLACAVGCRKQASSPPSTPPDSYIEVPAAVGFDIVQLPSENAAEQWLATYKAQDRVAKFRIVLNPASSTESDTAYEFDIKSGDGKIVAVPGSDATALLTDLKKALEAKHLPDKVTRTTALSFKYVTFGEHNSQAKDGGFSTKPRGNWRPMKIFIGAGSDEGQLFLNLNPVIGKGQFSEKDVDYGDIVLAKLASVL